MPLETIKPTFIETVFRKSLIAFPFLIVVFLVYGINHEHGDSNAGSMYPLVFAIHYIAISIVSYMLYVITDRITNTRKLNFIKNFVHLILFIGLLFFSNKAISIPLLLTLPTLLLINLSTALYELID
jgi:hypothetical protein